MNAPGSNDAPAATTPAGAPRQAVDVAVVGAGFVGLALALALVKATRRGLTVAVIDPAGGAVPADGRASAIAAGARRMLEALEAWPRDPYATQPILDMVVTDSRVQDGVRPSFLTFDGDVEPGEPFAHMAENAVIIGELLAECLREGIQVTRGRVLRAEAGPAATTLHLADGTTLPARLVAACDGARSALREAAGIKMVGWDYGQSGIVTTIVHERPHNGRAEEHFLPAGPFALLPLCDDAEGRHRSSLVWTETTAEAERWVAASDAAFLDGLVERAGHHLGAIALAGPRRAYPLGLRLARTFVGERLALVGDAAHVIHPIAGQGLNMGFRDVAALAEVVVDGVRLGQDPGSADLLRRYERWRRFDTAMMGAATDGLNRLFSNDVGLVRGARDLGLGLVDRVPGLKRFFIRNAAGLVGDLPKLLQGWMV